MTEKIKEKIKEFIIVLPKEHQEAINFSGWEKILEEIGKRHLLDNNEIDNLQLETGLVLTGIVDPILLALNIENEIGTSKTEAESIANEILQKILNPVVEYMNENIKKSLAIRNIHWRQNLDFILSGGDYTAFIRRVEPSSVESRKLKVESNQVKVNDLKDSFTI